MDSISDFFSPEALRLLEASGFDCEPVFQAEETAIGHGPATHLTQSELQEIDQEHSSSQLVPTYSTLALDTLTRPKRKRAKFNEEARKKVAAVRKNGACLRCRILKLPCSGSRPCISCNQNNVSCHVRESKRRWMDCVSYFLKDVDIYSLDFPCSYEEYESILKDNDDGLIGDARHTFDVEIRWDLENIVSGCAHWVLAENLKPESNSRVWIFSSFKAETLLSQFLGGNLSKAVRVLVETSSILHNWGMDASYKHYSSSDLWKIRSFAGSQVVHGLENALKNANLAKASIDILKALFLALLATIIAAGYSTSVSYSNEGVEIDSPRVTADAFGEAQKELLRTLAHHMILVAERAQVMSNQKANNLILERAYSIWRGKAIFEWETVRVNVSRSLEEDSQPLGHRFSLQRPGQLNSTGRSGPYSPKFFEPAPALSLDTFPELVSLDSFDVEPTRWAKNDNENLLPSYCLSCVNAVDANGICSHCPPVMHNLLSDGVIDNFDRPLSGLEPFGFQNSTNIDCMNKVGDQLRWSDLLHNGMGNIEGVYQTSNGLDLHDIPTTNSEFPCYSDTQSVPMDALDDSTFHNEPQSRNDCNEDDSSPDLTRIHKREFRQKHVELMREIGSCHACTISLERCSRAIEKRCPSCVKLLTHLDTRPCYNGFFPISVLINEMNFADTLGSLDPHRLHLRDPHLCEEVLKKLLV